MIPDIVKRIVMLLIGSLVGANLLAQEPGALNNTKVDGFRPIWFDLGQKSEYGSKYSGAFGTYTMKHRPMAIYSPEVDKTFFVFGGTTAADEKHLLCMISCYDHETGLVRKPTVVYDKGPVVDPHDNPALLIDPDGYLWVYVAHWTGKRWDFRFITRSTNNYDSGSLWVEGRTWTVIAPTEPGPQKWGQGGEIVSWISRNKGKSWKRAIRYTAQSPMNHCYVRRPESCKDPFWCFWADGNADVFSISHLFFADSQGNVCRLPYEMASDQEWAEPEKMLYR